MAAAVIVTAFISLYCESNWLEGAMLRGVYAIAALAFFFSPWRGYGSRAWSPEFLYPVGASTSAPIQFHISATTLPLLPK